MNWPLPVRSRAATAASTAIAVAIPPAAKPAGSPGQAEEAAVGYIVDVMPDHIAVGPVLPEPRQRGVDDFRIDLFNGVVVYAEALDDARPEAFHHDVGPFGKLVEDAATVIGFEVETQGLAVAQTGETGRVRELEQEGAAAALRVRLVNLDYVCAEVAEDNGTEGARPHQRHIQYPYPLQSRLHIALPDRIPVTPVSSADDVKRVVELRFASVLSHKRHGEPAHLLYEIIG